MGFSLSWSGFVALLFLLCMGGGVLGNCTEENMHIEGGTYSLSKQLETGSMLIYRCPEGDFPYPALSRLCHLNSRWRPAAKRFLPQRCRKVECPDPTVIQNGNVSPPQEKYFVNNETTYECYSGYTLRGSSRRVCLPNGKWSGATPICSRDSGNICPDPGVPAGATRTGNIFDIGYKVKYSCNANLYLVGSSERLCRENGQWTGIEPACYYRHTYDTPLEVSEAFGSSIKESLTKLESTEDTQEGRMIRITKNGTLNIYIAMDISESIQDKQLKKAKDAVETLIEKIASFSVSPNYEILFFSSEIHEVVNIMDFFVENKETHQSIFASIIKALREFERGDIEGAGTDLNLVFMTFRERMAFIKQRTGDGFKDHNHVLIIFTDGAYNMGGSPVPTVEKIKSMVYMNHSNPKAREEYLDIYIFGIGTEIFDEDLQPLTVGTGEKHYYRVKDGENLQLAFDEMIDEEDVKGLCGLHRNYETFDKDGKRRMHPWLAYVDVKGRKCLGSLVTPQFVLTAAHCFRFDDVPEDVQIEIDDRQVRKVKAYKLHEKFNITAKVKDGVKEFYDYDVALVQLEKDVTISTTARPICIPCTQETRAALKLAGDSTCADQEQLLLKSHLERLTFLTKSGNKIEEKDVHAKRGDIRDNCIIHALSAKGITTKNPKDAVTDNFLCTGGRDPQRDHIACTGDSGGALFRNYQQRTIQIALVSWGTEVLCESGGVVESSATSRDFHINLFRVIPFLKSVLGNDKQNDFAPLQFLEN